MKILLLSAYDADSHQYWRKGLVANFPQYQWQVLTLAARYFAWRVRGNSLSWAFGEQAAILKQDYDLIIATSMTDLSALRGFIPSLASIPTLVYFHENQFAYPTSTKARANVEPQILNLYTALAADKLVFNSDYNLQTLLTGAAQLLNKLPDQVPANIIALIKAKATVLPVPLIESATGQLTTAAISTVWDKYGGLNIQQRPLLIAWAARWEYDKGPVKLLAIVKELVTRRVNFRLCIMGQKFRQVPSEFASLQSEFAEYIDQFGYADSRGEYQRWLAQADIFLSTAVHEFQGLSVLEAFNANCVPALPDRLVYPELFTSKYLYESHLDLETEARAACQLMIEQWAMLKNANYSAVGPDCSWKTLKPDYQKIIEDLLH